MRTIQQMKIRDYQLTVGFAILTALVWSATRLMLSDIRNFPAPTHYIQLCLLAIMPMFASMGITLISVLVAWLLADRKFDLYYSKTVRICAITYFFLTCLWSWISYETHSSFGRFSWRMVLAMTGYYIGGTIAVGMAKRKKRKQESQ